MEESENWNENPWEYIKSIETVTMVSSSENLSFLSSTDPLFSCIITLYILVLLYFPQSFSLKILFSPVLILTASLLLSLLRLGAIQRIQTETEEKRSVSQAEAEKSEFSQQELKWVTRKKDPEPIIQSFDETFVEWDVRAPLEVIYEEYGEGEEPNENDPDSTRVIERYPSLSLYYPESDSDSSSSLETDFLAPGEWVSSEKICNRWEEEDRDGLIEIALDTRDLDFHGEEENLIEIDIS